MLTKENKKELLSYCENLLENVEVTLIMLDTANGYYGVPDDEPVDVDIESLSIYLEDVSKVLYSKVKYLKEGLK